MDFLAKFKKICATIDNPELAGVPIARYDKSVKESYTRLFNIYKRSLPPGLDKLILIGLTRYEAERWLAEKLKAKVFTDDARESKTLIYYDMLPQDATPRERSIYFNPRPVTQEGGSEPQEVEIVNNEWVG